MRSLSLLMTLAALVGCQGAVPTDDPSGGLYVYTDAQGNLVTMQRQSDAQPATPQPVKPETATSNQKTEEKQRVSQDNLEDYRPSQEVDEELAKRENERFVTYIDETGQLVSRPVDMGAERAAAEAAPPGYESLPRAGFLETYRPLRADCCLHMLEDAQELEPGSEHLIRFDEDSHEIRGEAAYHAQAYVVGAGVQQVSLSAFIDNDGYMAVELIWLNADGTPVMLIDQPFSRRYPETWYRYGYLQGTLQAEPGQQYLVVFLPYFEKQPGTDGLQQVTEGELVLKAD